jgi:hypothetical protein
MQSGTSSPERLTARTVAPRARPTLLAAAGGLAFALALRKAPAIADERPASQPAPEA